VTETATTIPGHTTQLRAWPASGKAIICGLELISYTGKQEVSSTITNLTGVTRNIGWHDGTTPGAGTRVSGSAGSGGPWPAGTSLRIAPVINHSYFVNQSQWKYPLSGTESPSSIANDTSDWLKRGPWFRNFFDMWRGIEIDFENQYSSWHQYGINNPNGFIGKFGTHHLYSRPAAWRIKTDGTIINWSNQYFENFFKLGGPYGSQTSPYPGIGDTKVHTAIGAADTTIYITKNTDSDYGNTLNLAGGVIRINNELIAIGSITEETNRVRLDGCNRGYNRTAAAAVNAGIGFPSGIYSGGRVKVKNFGLNIDQEYWSAGIDLVGNIQVNRSFWM